MERSPSAGAADASGECVPGAKYADDVLAATSPHLSVLDQLGDHLGVLWGALVAFAVVVLLTPAVGGMARRLGVVDAPGGRRVNQLPVPRLGGLALDRKRTRLNSSHANISYAVFCL